MDLPHLTALLTLADPSDAMGAMSALSDAGARWLELHDDASPTRVYGGFPEDSVEAVGQRVHAALSAHGVSPAAVGVAPAIHLDWKSGWEGTLRPRLVDPLWIIPPGHPAPANAPSILLPRVDAFGTGQHTSTALCLERLTELSMPPRILDVGTGSGILMLAALRLGARTAVGTDNDPAALSAAHQNAQANQLRRFVRLSSAAPDALGQRFALVVANILAAPLVALAPHLVKALSPGGCLILGGVRETQAQDVARAFTRWGLRRAPDVHRDGWTRLEFLTSW
jgi:ribosomal protein L11 methyltransferase